MYIDKFKQWIGISKFNELILIRRKTSVIIIEYFPLVSDGNNPITYIPVCLRPVLKRSKANIELHVVKRVKLYHMLQTQSPVIFSVIVFILMRFRPFSTVHTYTICCAFVLIHFQESFQIDAFSMKTLGVLVWTEGLSASKCMRGFQTKSH